MMIESLTSNTLLVSIAITLIHFLWQGFLVALVLKFLLSFISYQKPQARYALATTAMLMLFTLPLITLSIIYDSGYRQVANLIHTLPLLEHRIYLDSISTNTWYSNYIEYLSLITITWLGIVSLLTAKLLIELYSVNKLPLQGTIPADIQLQSRFILLIKKVNLSKNVRLLLSNKIATPMAIGWLKPVVLIPVSMVSGLTPQQLDMLLLHELAHIRRHDYLTNFLQTLVETLLFFHPAVRWVSKQMRNEREYCSDDIAVEHGCDAIAYAHTLADTASLCHQHRRNTIPLMAMAASGGDLKQRVTRLLDNQPHCANTNDTGRWLASFTILIIITFSVFQYLFTLPLLGLQASDKPLSHSTSSSYPTSPSKNAIKSPYLTVNKTALFGNTLISKEMTKRTTLSDNSIRKKVINADLSIPKDKLLSTDINITKFASNSDTNKQLTSKLTYIQNTKPKQNFVQSHTQKVTQKHTQFKTAILQHDESLDNNSVMSELAFARTDSKSKTSILSNPYSKQVASLLNTSAPFNSKLKTKNRTEQVTQSSNHALKSTYNTLTSPDNKLGNNVEDSLQIKYNRQFEKKYKLQPSHLSAKLIKSIEPKYPSSAKRNNIEIDIKVEFSINKSGLVKNIQFESKGKAVYFRNAIRNAMKQWRFKPAEKNGYAVESRMSKIFSFNLVK